MTWMKEVPSGMAFIALAALLSCAALLPATASGAFDRLTVQGQLRNSTNDVVSGYFNFSFSLYDQPAGGNLLFQQNVTGLHVDANGLYTYTLQNVDLPFDQDYYLGIAVNNDTEMSPRLNMTDAGTVALSNSTSYLGSLDQSYFLNSSAAEQTVGSNITIADTLLVGTGGYAGGGLSLSSSGHVYVAGGLYINGILIPATGRGINGSDIPSQDDSFSLGSSESRWQTAYIGTGGIYSNGGISAFSGSGYANLTTSDSITSSNTSAGSIITTTGMSISGLYRTSWPQQGNSSSDIIAAVDNGTFVKISGSTMSGGLGVGSNLTVDSGDLFVDSSTGRIGIGKLDPTTVIDARSQSGAAFLKATGFSDGENYAAVDLWNQTGDRAWRLAQTTASSLLFRYYGGSVWISPFSLLPGGNIGIYTASPSQRLEVNGSVNVTGNIVSAGGVCVSSSGSCASPGAGNVSADGALAAAGISLGGDYRTYWEAEIGNTSAEIWASVDNGTFVELAESAMTGSLGVNTNLTVDSGDLFVDSSTGNVGIGTTQPSEKLRIQGGTAFHTASSPTLKGSYSSSTYLDGASFVQVSGRYAYVTSYYSDSLTIIDVSDPSNPTYLGSYINSTSMESPSSVKVSGRYAYVTAYASSSLDIIDVSDPADPTPTGIYTDSERMFGANSLYLSGKYAYISSLASNSLTIIDVSDPENPAYVGNYSSNTYLDGAGFVKVSGRYAYVTTYNTRGLTIIDVSDPENPAYVGNYSSDIYMIGPQSVDISGKYAYVATFSNRLTVLDVSDPEAPAYVGSYYNASCLSGANSVQVSGEYAYVASYNSDSLSVVDISDPTNPALAGVYISSTYLNYSSSVQLSGKYAYVAAWDSDGLAVLGISGIDSPSASMGDIAASSVHVSEDSDIGGDIGVGSGLAAGPGGISSEGPLSVSSSSDTYFNRNLSIGTTDASAALTVNGDVNITEDGSKLYVGSGATQYFNGTCMIITGPTSRLEVCP